MHDLLIVFSLQKRNLMWKHQNKKEKTESISVSIFHFWFTHKHPTCDFVSRLILFDAAWLWRSKSCKKEKNLTQLRNYLIEEKEEGRGGAWAGPPAREGHGCGCKAVTCGLETSSSGVTASVPGCVPAILLWMNLAVRLRWFSNEKVINESPRRKKVRKVLI